MKNLQGYKAIINDPASQRALRELYENNISLTDEVKNREFMAAFVDLDLSISQRSIGSFESICSTALDNITLQDVAAMTSRIHQEVEAVDDMTIYQPPVFTTDESATSGIYLYKGKNIEVMLFVLDKFNLKAHKQRRTKKGITIQANDLVIQCLSGSGSVSKYTLHEKFSDEHGAPEQFSGVIDTRTYSSGTIMSVRKGQDGITFATCDLPSVFISITETKHTMLVKPQYDIATSRLVGSVHADGLSSRIQMASVMLRMLNVKGTCDLLKPLLESENLYVRWQVAREIFLNDAEKAKTVFEQLTNDTSAQIREASIRCLNEFYGEKYAVNS
ncbi:HEAT repeat domain-containing protein [Alteromonas halophila]|uniref:HEAT repeat domain-containing protein n=1 Tax=Alteromonas halophila TaxID=516698 RepID=A0A918JLN6_9ALTE|nr:HEAT repeat domain-containing protein [Alteromonas halophila]GGW83912.1 hypothetical protein GCM10007391_16910 [Alteromonas halophila]